jgi:uncharacterized protein YjiS (DUF1127 family)
MRLAVRPSEGVGAERRKHADPLFPETLAAEQNGMMEMIMSTILSTPASAQGVGWPSWARSLGATLKRRWVAYLIWRIERAAAVRLFSMSDRQLKDIGLTRSGIAGALREVAHNEVSRRYY